ncbi:MAG TPA: hypothetical protein DIW23_13160 [Anaerolineae bacterium]|nr:hypothetical protein [Anaerolineae bacterium]
MKNLHRISILYLIFPFLLFLFGWFRLSIAIPISLIIIFTLYKLLKNNSPILQLPKYSITNYQLLPSAFCLLLTGSWLFLSGIGGYAFQNWDHHWRNAVFHDLINFDFPVYYSQPENGPIKMLVYYVGYWLPSALIGKYFDWGIANLFLFLWSWLGVILVTLQFSNFLKTSPIKTTLLLIFFSGLDSLGVLFFPQEYPTLFPFVTHLEIWSGNLQYSSFTTQLFWVFNQAIPAWLSIIVIASRWPSSHEVAYRDQAKQSHDELGIAWDEEQERPRNDIVIFLWSLCFFFAPIASIGLLPYVLIEIFKNTNLKSLFKNINYSILASSIIIFLLSYFFFSANTAAQTRGLQIIPFKEFIFFFLLEGGILWLLLAPIKYRDPRWIVTGVLLIIIPFIQIGSGRDFVMRASIAPLFYLMILTGETIFSKQTKQKLLIPIYLLLFIGALAPLYEINRSIYRTYEYYFILDEEQRLTTLPMPATEIQPAGRLEAEHPNRLVADEIVSLEFMQGELAENFIANVRQTLYYKYLAKR